jgi:CheY-like chemotaxis protein
LTDYSKRVLVVEDDFLIRMVMADRLRDSGFQVVEAATADDAVTILDSDNSVAIVFTDIDMPGSMDGIQLTLVIRTRWPAIKVVIASGHAMRDGRNIPADTKFFPKPYDLDEVAQFVGGLAV